jgi:hypothetical protein
MDSAVVIAVVFIVLDILSAQIIAHSAIVGSTVFKAADMANSGSAE